MTLHRTTKYASMGKMLMAVSVLLLCGRVAICQERNVRTASDTVSVIFGSGSSAVDTSAFGNSEALDSMLHIFSSGRVTGLYIKGWASPEGSSSLNERLARERALSLRDWLVSRGVTLPSGFTANGAGIDWGGAVSKVFADTLTPYRSEVLETLQDVPVWVIRDGKVVGGRKHSLMEVGRGDAFRYMLRNHFGDLRRSEAVITWAARPEAVPLALQAAPVQAYAVYRPDRLERPGLTETGIGDEMPSMYRWALKTNLLYDAILMPSLELEYLINEKWSVAAIGDVAWWSIKPRHQYYQIATIYPEARWWFKTKNPWHGHYLGMYAGGTWYDLENGGRGYKGEGGFAGISYGYMFPVGRNLSLEFEVGVGYLYTEYEEYLPVPYEGTTHYVYQQTSALNYVGPLKLKFSLVWRFWDIYKKRGGAR